MRLPKATRFLSWPRSGKTLVLFVLVAPVLLGMIGVIIDGGILMASYRQAQNAADAAALGAAMDLFRGSGNTTALATAQSFVTNNGMSATLSLNGGNSPNTLNIPPQVTTVTQYQDSKYAEVVVSKTVSTLFIQILGINSSQTVTARAVAGYEPVGAGEGCFVLDSSIAPGLQINTNNTRLVVNGDITVNSTGGGVDQFGNTVDSALNSDAVKTSVSTTTPAPIVATTLNVVGGISNIDNARTYDAAFSASGNYYDTSNIDRPLIARVPIAPDPLTPSNTTSANNLPPPTTSPPAGTRVIKTFPKYLGSGNWDLTQTTPQDISIGNSDTVTFSPGIYSSIKITGGTVTFQSGIYVLSPQSNTTNTFSVTGGTITGSGVMFYNTASNYDPDTGLPDSNDLNTTSNLTNQTHVGAVSIGGSNGASIALSPLADSGPFNGFLFYQRRWNTSGASFTKSSGATMSFSGTLYAKWANFKLSGQGTYNAQFLVGSMNIDGGATVTIDATGKNLGKANLVFLVE
ncbi:MAG: pilus assembly protein TadG-related protein [Gemmataceae bacterium]